VPDPVFAQFKAFWRR